MKQDVQFCTSPDGVKLAYGTSGRGAPLVMVRWLSHLEREWHSLAWRPWLNTLCARYKVLRYDARGCGLSDRDAADLSFDSWIRDLECVADSAGVEKFDLLGMCWGGSVAIEYAARHPERVRRLILCGSYARGRFRRGDRPAEIEKARVLLDATRLGWGKENHAFAKLWAMHYQPGGTFEHLRSWCDQQCAATSGEMAARLFEVGWSIDVQKAARNVKCPVLILHAERDAVVPVDEGRLIASLIPGSHFVLIDSENHMPLADEPAWRRIVGEIDGFLAPATVETPPSDLPLSDLTARERDVLDAIARGLDNNEIATALGVSEKTVRNHVTRVLDKIGAEHRYQAIVRAREAGLGLNKAAPAP